METDTATLTTVLFLLFLFVVYGGGIEDRD